MLPPACLDALKAVGTKLASMRSEKVVPCSNLARAAQYQGSLIYPRGRISSVAKLIPVRPRRKAELAEADRGVLKGGVGILGINSFSQSIRHGDDQNANAMSCSWNETPLETTHRPSLGGDEGRSPSFLESAAAHNDQKVSPDHSAELCSSESRLAPRGGLMERIATRTGFNPPKLNTKEIRANGILNTEARSPGLKLSPGLSPTILLESPVFISNSLHSPTTERFSFVPPNSSSRCLILAPGPNRIRDKDLVEDNDSSFAFNPVAELRSSFFSSEPKITPISPQQSFPRREISAQPDATLQSSNRAERPTIHPQTCFSPSMMEKHVSSNNSVGTIPSDQRMLENTAARDDQSSPLDEEDQKGNTNSTLELGSPSEVGYNGRKYGHKQVMDGGYPRSYYKCTHPDCQVKKNVEQSYDGRITEIIYKGAHNLPCLNQAAKGSWKGNFELPSSPSDEPGYSNPNNIGPENQNSSNFEPGRAVEASSPFSNDEHPNDQANGSVLLDPKTEEYVESKRRKIEAYPADMTGATRAIQEPRFVVQTTSDVDILDDGYRWRKYGQKVVKGNPNPRSYYKRTSQGCPVRKHVERASHNLKSVITTYEGKHNHDIPAARNSSHGNMELASTHPVASGVQANVHRQEPSQAHLGSLRFAGPGALATLGLPGRPRLSHQSFGLNAQPRMPSLVMAGRGGGNGNMLMLPIHPFLAAQQQNHANQMTLILPKGELKPEHMADAGLNRLPLRPHM
ncbi:hypothetical protein SAY86_016705 [Trapa natans]|uniref:WRKY domain-containing protein n=1 Tax=Trapa natans TaxID=22666 RepID=A0AAN7LGI4_TRANT|nr:hypothetical protein SAY86_016705 [Trapa natans]